MGTKTARLEPPAGSMTEEHREALLRHLLRASEGMGKPMMADEVRAAGSLTVPQLGAFMGWAHGQVLVHEGESFACVLERGVQARWLRFRCVQRRAAGKAFTRRAGA